MEEWKEYKLGEILNFRRGHDLPHSKMKAGNVPVAGSNGIIGYHDDFTPISPCITIGRSGNVGTPYIYEQCWAHNTVLYVDDFKGNYPLYLYYLLKTLPLSSFGGGSAVPTLNRNHIHPLVIRHTPNINTQKKVVSILKSLDDKIEVNRRINDNLEKQAQTLFKSWFVDFEPFKDQPFEESELGMIPKGWKVGTLGDIAELRKPSIKPQDKIFYTHYSIPAFDNNKKPSVDEGSTIKSNKFGINDGAVLLSKLNPSTKRIWYTGNVPEHSVSSTEFQPFYSKNKEFTPFIYCYLNCDSNYREIANGAKGTTNSHQRIDANSILIRGLAYSEEAIRRVSDCCQKLMELILEANQESRRLAALRDTLLPKLMSGQISLE